MSFRVLPLAAGLLFVATACSASKPTSENTPTTPVTTTSATAATTGQVGPNDWPQWRGQNRDGKSPETGLLKSWPKDGPPKAWTVGNLGSGFSTPSVAAGMIYGMGTRDGKDGVWALNEADGKEAWFTAFDNPRDANPNNGPGSTPTYANGKVYAVSNRGALACLDAGTGKVVWTKRYTEDFGGSAQGWGYNDSVLVDGDKVICAPASNKAAVVALKAGTGETVWTADVGPVGGGAGYSSPIKATIGGIPMYVVLLGDKAGVVGVHADSGKLLWQYNKKPAAGGVAQVPTPVIEGNRVWVSSSYSGGAALLELTPQGKDHVSVKEVVSYPKPELNNHHGGMVLVDGYVYFGHDQNKGIPACVEMKTGKIVWKEDREPAGMSGSAAVSFADGRLYFRYQNHVLALVEPSPTEFKLVSSFKLPEPSGKQSWPHPVIANGKLYIRDQEKLHCFNIKATTN